MHASDPDVLGQIQALYLHINYLLIDTYIYVYMYTWIYIKIYIHMCIYKERERERENACNTAETVLPEKAGVKSKHCRADPAMMYIYIFISICICMHIYVYIERWRHS